MQIILDNDSAATIYAARDTAKPRTINPNATMAKRQTKRKRKVPTVKLDELHRTTNDNLDATMHSIEGPTRVAQAIASQIAEYSKYSIEQGSKTMEKLLGAKSPDKAMEVQAEYAKAAYESYVSHATKLGQLYTDLARETFKSCQDFAAKVTPVR